MNKCFTSRLFQKMFVSFLAVALVPLCAVYFYINSRYSIRMEENAAKINRLAEQNAAVLLNNFLMQAEYLSNIFFNTNTQKLLKEAGKDELSTYNHQMMLEREVRVNLDLYNTIDSVDQVAFLKKDGTYYQVSNSRKQTDMIPFTYPGSLKLNTFKNHIFLSTGDIKDGKLVYIRRINDVEAKSGELGYLFVVLDKAQIGKTFEGVMEVLDTRIVLNDSAGNVLYANFHNPSQWLLETGSKASGIGEGERGKSPWVRWDYNIKNFGLTVTFYDEIQKLNFNIQELTDLTEVVIMLTIIVILIASLLFAKTMVTPILRLHDRLDRVRSGDFKVSVPIETRDELGDLGLAFNDMAMEIDRLVNQVYAIEIREKETAIAALQAQINPHFLYNTLDMIKSMADIYGAEEVGPVIVALSGLFRYATHTDTVVVTIGEELDNLRNYMKIVNARLGGRIRYGVEVPENLLNVQIVKVCFQPIVENAISYGLRRGGSRLDITVRLKKVGEDMVIEVQDDGIGMDGQRMAEIRRRLLLPPRETIGARAGSVGLKNIHDRIRLYYGGQYGVAIESIPGKGTKVTVRYPAYVTLEKQPQPREGEK